MRTRTLLIAALTVVGIGIANDAQAAGRNRTGLARQQYVPLPPRRGDGGSVFALVTRSAQMHGVPAALAHAVVRVESNYKCNARNASSSAKGLMQVLDGTARGVGVHGNRLDCHTGVEAGMRYLAQAYRMAGGNLCAAATAYNSGRMGTRNCSGSGRKVTHLAGL